MKLIAWVIGCCLCLSSSVFAANQHMHKQDKKEDKVQWVDGCKIEIINQSFSDVRVYGYFDDGSSLDPFKVFSFEAPQYISLYYYGYCHSGMDLDIDSVSGYNVFSGYVRTGATLRIVPYLNNQVKAELSGS